MKPQVHIAWGPQAVASASKEGKAIAIVDVLRFSSTVVTAIANGFEIYPCESPTKARQLEARTGAVVSGKFGTAKFSLSPLNCLNPKETTEVILVSPNGAACSTAADPEYSVFIGSFLNARATARALTNSTNATNGVILVAAGEVAEDQFDDLQTRRFALEDYLGCGAILSQMRMPMTPEAEICKRAFEYSLQDYVQLIRECDSGKYLVERNQEADIVHCVQRDLYGVVPIARGGKVIPFNS